MKTLILRLNDDEYKLLEEEARKEGFPLLADYVKYVLFSSPLKGDSINVQRIERRVQDMINPFTQQVDEMKRKVAEVVERMNEIEEMLKSPVGREASPPKYRREEVESQSDLKQEKNPQEPRAQPQKLTVADLLKKRKVLYEQEMTKIRDIEAFFGKIRSTGIATIIPTANKGRIAIELEFLDSLVKKLSEISISDPEVASSKLDETERKLFKTLVDVGLIYYDNDKKHWVMINGKT